MSKNCGIVSGVWKNAVYLTSLTLVNTQVIASPLQADADSFGEVISALTTEQKVSLVLGTGMEAIENGPAVGMTLHDRVPGAAGNTFPVADLNIPSLVLADGPAGVRIKPTRENDQQTYYGTAFPIASLLASSWDVELIESVGKAMGNEAKEYGVDVLLGPALNIHRYPLGGRNFEYFSEDPLVSGKMAASIVSGVQSQGVGTSIKHFVANNHEWNRGTIDVQMDDRTLREIYLRGFEIAIKEGQPWTVMSSYNQVNGEAASENSFLLTEVLRNQWGFNGFVMTDWYGGKDVVKQMNAGNDLLMPGTAQQQKSLLSALKDGSLDEAVIDRNITNLLQVMTQSPVFANYSYSDAPDLKNNAAIARRAATEGMVLLKNNDQILPLSNDSHLAVLGNYSYDMVTGGTGSGDVNEAYVISLRQGLESAGFSSDDTLPDLYNKHIAKEKAKLPEPTSPLAAFFPTKPLNELPISAKYADKLASESDVALLTIGRSSGEFEDIEKEAFYLTEKEEQLINRVSTAFHKQQKPVVVVMNIGGVIEMASWIDKVDAILLAYQPGQEAGNAIADVLTGNMNPSGKLIDTIPYDLKDYPAFAGFPGRVTDVNAEPEGIMQQVPAEVTYDDGIWVGYRYFNSNNIPVVYPFGYGLSYTSFEYSDLELSSAKFDDQITATVEIKNTGKVAGKESVQLYVSAPEGKLEKPSEELRAFGKTELLAPGESETLTFTLSARDLTSYDAEHQTWLAESGQYWAKIGASSRDFKLKASFVVKEDIRINP